MEKKTQQKVYRLSSQGEEKLKNMGLSNVEMKIIQTSLEEGISKASQQEKNKYTKATLFEVIDKLVQNLPWFVEQQVTGGASATETEEEKTKQAANFHKVLTELAVKEAEGAKDACAHYMRGACRFGREGKDCTKDHPQTCREFEKKGDRGCQDPCPASKTHRKICKAFEKGTCNKGNSCTSGIHPNVLGQILEEERKKSEEEKAEKEQTKNDRALFLSEMEKLKTAMEGLQKGVEDNNRKIQALQPVQYVQQPFQQPLQQQILPVQQFQPAQQYQPALPPPPLQQGGGAGAWPNRQQ